MRVTAIKQQVKQKERYSIYVDGAYGFSLSEAALLESGIANGQELTAVQLTDYKRQSSEDKLYSRALKYAVRRRRSKWEVQEYLRRLQTPPALTDIILNKLSVYEFIDDRAFADAWIANRQLLRPLSRRRLQQELRAKHVSDDIIQRVLWQESGSDDRDALRDLITRKRRQTRYQDDEKLKQYLARQGFSYDDINTCIQEAL